MKNDLWKSIMAGMAIALGCCLYLLAPNPIIGAVLFSCGLLCVRIYGLNLFTGKIQYIVTEKYKSTFYPFVLVGNFIGVIIIWLCTFTITSGAAIPVATAKAT